MDLLSARASKSFYSVIAILFIALLSSGSPVALGQQMEQQNAAPAEEAPKIPNDQLDSLVAPIALYPDPLLSQTLVASTYPVELIQLQQWMAKNKGLKDQALTDAVAKQPWDASIQGMAAFPDVVEKLAGNVQWTSDLGNAFLAQQTDVMAAVQRMRAKAQKTGTLKTSAQQKVETQTVEGGQQAIVIQPASSNVVYVPSYDPVVVYGPPAYPYPPVTYPGYVPGMGLAFGTGLALGAAWGGGWGYGCGWGHGDVNVNYNNKYVNNSNKNVSQANRSNSWQHNPQHRGNAPYGNKQTANKYAGAARAQGGAGAGARPGGGVGAAPGAGTRPGGGVGAGSGAGARPGGGIGAGTGAGAAGGPGSRPGGGGASAGGRPAGGGGAGARPGGGGGAGARPGGGASTMPASRPGGGGANSIGAHKPSAGGGGGAFGGGSGPSARAASSRGGASMGGGGARGGGGGGRRR